MPRSLHYGFTLLIVAMLFGGPLAYSSYRHSQMRNFHIVREGVLLRSGQMTLTGLQRVVYEHGVKTVISLRDGTHAGKPAPDNKEEEWCRKQELNYIIIPPRAWWAEDGSSPAEVGVKTFLDVMADSNNYPVLIHCFAGVHRTGAYCAVYRMEHDRWSNEQAIDELKRCGYVNLDDEWDILGYLEQYRPSWKGPADPLFSPRRPPVKPGRKQ